MQKYPILVLVGPAAGGKTTLLKEMLKRFPDKCAPIKSLITRPRRGPEDDLFYDFVTVEDFQQRVARDEIFQTAFHAGNWYGCDRQMTDAVVKDKIGLVVLVQQSVADFIKAGYKLHLVYVKPLGHTPRNDPARIKDDEEREKIKLDYQSVIVNEFGPGGFEKAANELENVVKSLLIDLAPTLTRTYVDN